MKFFKSGDKVKGYVIGLDEYVTGHVIGIDYDDQELTYLVSNTDGIYWLETDTVTLVEEKDCSKYNKLLTFVNAHDIPISTVNEVAKHLDKIEKIDIDIEHTKQLCEQNENETKRLYDKLSELEKERNELQNKTTD